MGSCVSRHRRHQLTLCVAGARTRLCVQRQHASSSNCKRRIERQAVTLSPADVRLIQASYEIIKRSLKPPTTIGTATYHRTFLFAPELQHSFGFNHITRAPLYGRRCRRSFTGHAGAFQHLFDLIVDSIGKSYFDDDVATMLAQCGAKHWDYVHTGFDAKYIWAFTQALQTFVEMQTAKIENFNDLMTAQLLSNEAPFLNGNSLTTSNSAPSILQLIKQRRQQNRDGVKFTRTQRLTTAISEEKIDDSKKAEMDNDVAASNIDFLQSESKLETEGTKEETESMKGERENCAQLKIDNEKYSSTMWKKCSYSKKSLSSIDFDVDRQTVIRSWKILTSYIRRTMALGYSNAMLSSSGKNNFHSIEEMI